MRANQPPKNLAGYDPVATAEGCRYDHASGQIVVDFFRDCLRHVEGSFAGKPFLLQPWQEDFIRTLFGWKNKDGSRRYRTAYLEVGRGNGKSTLGAAIALWLLFCDGEQRAQVYCCAGAREQAGLVYGIAADMVRREPALLERCKVRHSQKRIVVESSRSFLKAIAAKADTAHGFNTSGCIFDELHVQPNRDLWDTIETSKGKSGRRHPLTVAITTAGWDRNSICYEVHDYATKIRDGILDDQTFLPVIFSAKETDDWTDEHVWETANPGLDVTVSREHLRRKCEEAKQNAALENTFRRLYLSQWTESDVRWLQMDKWDKCGESLRSLEGRPCYAGLDLASTSDLTALVLLFPDDDGSYDVLPFFWVPKESARRRERRDHVPYMRWIGEDVIRTTDGDTTDYDTVRAGINEIASKHQILEIAIDRLFQGAQLSSQLQEDGFEVVAFGQGFYSMAAPTAECERLVRSDMLRHANHPILRWMASNVTVEVDAAGNMKPSKKKSSEKIDGIVAMIMAIGRAIVGHGEQIGSFYEDNELEFA